MKEVMHGWESQRESNQLSSFFVVAHFTLLQENGLQILAVSLSFFIFLIIIQNHTIHCQVYFLFYLF